MNEQTQNGGPAFPIQSTKFHDGDCILTGSAGMSLRDYFAAQALAGYVANGAACEQLSLAGKNSPETYAQLSYAMADAMLKARAAK